MIINKLPIKNNYTKKATKKTYIIIHDTGNPSPGAGAYNHYLYFNGEDRQASAHYFVDDHNIIETVDPHLVAWHCGDGRGRYGITNTNSIGIEICINPESDYKMAKAQTIELIRFLMMTYNIPKKNVKRHYDASRKPCPATMAKDDWREWKDFWKRI
ncbi:MAG: peptidoglycan recognition family protein [Bacillota bacterium]|nr:peptidoglycan recognition family protein [Bacillota bacterium]